MTIKSFATSCNKTPRTVSRWIHKFNNQNSTDFPSGSNDLIEDSLLMQFLEYQSGEAEPVVVELDVEQKAVVPEVKKKVKEKVVEEKVVVPADEMTNLQRRLSNDWLIVFVLLVILCADMIAFSIIGEHEFQDKIKYANIIFAILGLATGTGSVVTYNRLEDFKLSEIWKWCFGVLQFCVFSFTINERWFLAESTMTIMFVLVFIGVQRSIKK